MKSIFIILSTVFLTAFTLPPRNAPEYKTFYFWNENRKLVWSDFQGKLYPNAPEMAMTASSVEYSYSASGTKFQYEVLSKFFPKLSWKKNTTLNAYMLQHEQTHFDITELYARLMRKRLSEEIKTAKDISKISKIGSEITVQWKQEQTAYDSETEHSIDTVKQAEWNANIQERLVALKQFASI